MSGIASFEAILIKYVNWGFNYCKDTPVYYAEKFIEQLLKSAKKELKA
jgi:hypothetical protein